MTSTYQNKEYDQNELELAKQRLANPWWRLNNLYCIEDKRGQLVLFKANSVQTKLDQNLHNCNVILKARQMGISTYISLLLLDTCLFNANKHAGIIAHTREDAIQLFKRIKFAYDRLPGPILQLLPATNDSARELVFKNGSSIRVGTSMRGSTLQYLHISEFGKICAKFPDKAQEIMTGSLNTIASGQFIFIESTAEGREGYFYEICKKAQKMKEQNAKLSPLDFKFHFFPWYEETSYQTGSIYPLTNDLLEYFQSLENMGIELQPEQKYWYASKYSTQLEDMRREFPSIPDEAWEVANNGAYYLKHLNRCRHEKRICNIPYDTGLEVHTAWDLGFNDQTAIWFFQIAGKEIHVIDFHSASGVSLEEWIIRLKKMEYNYGIHLAPHDINTTEYSTGHTRLEKARMLNFNFLASPKTLIIEGIDAVRNIFPRLWFDQTKCKEGLHSLENYTKIWDDRHGCWMKSPLHNWASHAADAFRVLATGLNYIVDQRKSSSKSPFDTRFPGGK